MPASLRVFDNGGFRDYEAKRVLPKERELLEAILAQIELEQDVKDTLGVFF